MENHILKKKQNKNTSKYWYKMFVGECPVCGSDKSYRQRVYGKKPKNISDRYVFLSYKETYDYCDI